ncbi:MAG: hypothetical protein JSR24_19830 [Proteobacteria bacterium]|nr:hypothetical protein [Pseudomonadota bacterium]
MARIRTIKPEFFTSDDICALSPLARLLYVALWCEADREGRLVWTPGVLKRRYLPDDSCDIEALGGELVGRGLVRLYGEGLAWLPSFGKHQHVNVREAQSKLPSPCAEAGGDLPSGREGERNREGEGTDGTRAQPLTPDWKPDEEDLAWAAGARPDLDGAALEAESERFRNHALANRRTAHRWGPAWRLWVSKAHGPDKARGDNRNRPERVVDNLPERESEAQWRARLARYRPGRFWLEGDWGPRPESGQSRVPAAMLAEWRRQDGGPA